MNPHRFMVLITLCCAALAGACSGTSDQPETEAGRQAAIGVVETSAAARSAPTGTGVGSAETLTATSGSSTTGSATSDSDSSTTAANATTTSSATTAATAGATDADTTPPTSTSSTNTGPTAQPGDANDAFNGGGTPRCTIFPFDNWWNRPVTDLPVHARSAAWVSGLGDRNLHPDFGSVWDGKAIGIPYMVVGGDQPGVSVDFIYASESEPGPYPIPPNAPIEDGSDRHVIVIDDSNCLLYELFDATPIDGGSSWRAASGAVFDLGSNALRPDGWTSADAAGLPIYPGLVTYEEVVVAGRIDHALRFTADRTQRAYIRPATHFASSITDPNVAPMGARLRLKTDYDCSGYSSEVQVICTALKTYGMFLADNGTSWHISGAPDARWNDSAIGDLKRIPGSAFEVVDTGEPLTN